MVDYYLSPCWSNNSSYFNLMSKQYRCKKRISLKSSFNYTSDDVVDIDSIDSENQRNPNKNKKKRKNNGNDKENCKNEKKIKNHDDRDEKRRRNNNDNHHDEKGKDENKTSDMRLINCEKQEKLIIEYQKDKESIQTLINCFISSWKIKRLYMEDNFSTYMDMIMTFLILQGVEFQIKINNYEDFQKLINDNNYKISRRPLWFNKKNDKNNREINRNNTFDISTLVIEYMAPPIFICFKYSNNQNKDREIELISDNIINHCYCGRVASLNKNHCQIFNDVNKTTTKLYLLNRPRFCPFTNINLHINDNDTKDIILQIINNPQSQSQRRVKWEESKRKYRIDKKESENEKKMIKHVNINLCNLNNPNPNHLYPNSNSNLKIDYQELNFQSFYNNPSMIYFNFFYKWSCEDGNNGNFQCNYSNCHPTHIDKQVR